MIQFDEPSPDELKAVAKLKEDITPNVQEYKEKYGDKIAVVTEPDRWTKELSLLTRLTDTTILRFYRGEKGDMVKALVKMEEFLSWRMAIDADLIEPHMFQKETDCNKIFCGDHIRDINGRPAILYMANRHNSKDREIEMVTKHLVHTLDQVIYKLSIGDERMAFMFDLGSFTLSCMDLECVKLIVDLLQNNYPETLQIGLLLDAPMLFSAFWAVIKPWLDPDTREKIQFIKRKDLPKYFNVNALPPEFR